MNEALKRITNLEEIGRGSIQTVYKDNGYVYKVFDSSRFNLKPEQVCDDIQSYYEACKRARVVVPEEAVIPYCVDGTTVANRYSYEGAPFSNHIGNERFTTSYTQLLENVNRGTAHNLGLSPFHEQYVVGDRGLVFVDFLVPALKEVFGRYKSGEDAINYFLVQFSRKSTLLSAYTHYSSTFSGKELLVKKVFSDFVESSVPDLYREPVTKGWVEWYLAHQDLFDQYNAVWLRIRQQIVVERTNLVNDVVRQSEGGDVIYNKKRKRIFTMDEIMTGLNEVKGIIPC